MTKPFHNPFAGLAHLGSRTPDEPATDRAPAETPAAESSAPTRVARAVVRLERSGRSGKAVTVVEHLGLPPSDREAWLKALKAALGCGGAVEGEALVLQGDQRTRLPDLLRARGVRKVTLGS